MKMSDRNNWNRRIRNDIFSWSMLIHIWIFTICQQSKSGWSINRAKQHLVCQGHKRDFFHRMAPGSTHFSRSKSICCSKKFIFSVNARRWSHSSSICFVIISAGVNFVRHIQNISFSMSHLNWCAQLNLRISFVVRISLPLRIPTRYHGVDTDARMKRTSKWRYNNNFEINLRMGMIAVFVGRTRQTQHSEST